MKRAEITLGAQVTCTDLRRGISYPVLVVAIDGDTEQAKARVRETGSTKGREYWVGIGFLTKKAAL